VHAKAATFFGILVAVVAVAALVMTNGSAAEGMEWKEVRIGVWVARLGLMKPLYNFLALNGPEINTMVIYWDTFISNECHV
jgi:hypothetical protein